MYINLFGLLDIVFNDYFAFEQDEAMCGIGTRAAVHGLEAESAFELTACEGVQETGN